MHVHFRRREVGQAPRVVEVQMREHDMPHVLALETERLDLRQRRHVRLRGVDLHHRTEERAESARVAHVIDADSRVDEHEPVRVGLEQQTVRGHPNAREAGAHRAAVEVMDVHGP
jgi:hypothetical protein